LLQSQGIFELPRKMRESLAGSGIAQDKPFRRITGKVCLCVSPARESELKRTQSLLLTEACAALVGSYFNQTRVHRAAIRFIGV
jgi:hypothetical protein